MKLADELQGCGCQLSPKEFNQFLISRLMESFPGRSIDSVVCTPADAAVYCGDVRNILAAPGLHDIVILKPLMNIRKRKDCPTGLKASEKRTTLRKKLQEVGCALSSNAFETLAVDCLADMYKNKTIDSVVCHPTEAAKLCNYVRSRANCLTLNDHLILFTLMNIRKKAGNS